MNRKLNAVGDDAETLLTDVRALLAATASSAEEKVVEARRRLSETLDEGRSIARRKAAQADEYVRGHSYETAAIAFGVGVLAGLLVGTNKYR